MDPSLLKEREAFKRRAISTPVVENRKKKDSQHEPPSRKKAKTSSQPKTTTPKPPNDPFSYKTMQGSSQYKFGVLAKIVKHMKHRHQNGDTHPLNFDEILDETNQLDLGPRLKRWLVTEALISNPKIQVTSDSKYMFKPPYNIRDKRGLLRLLDNHDQRGLGGILHEDIQESLPNTDKAVKLLGDNVTFIIRPIDKKKVLFFNDKSCQSVIDEEFQKLWRSVAVDGIDENKIEEYLEKQGITSMQDHGMKKVQPIQKRKRAGQKKNSRSFKRHNDHLNDILEDYSDK